jgi:hypothetical protein
LNIDNSFFISLTPLDGPISRLKGTWERVPKKVMSKYQKILPYFETKGSVSLLSLSFSPSLLDAILLVILIYAYSTRTTGTFLLL